jgi:hypothetical protein
MTVRHYGGGSAVVISPVKDRTKRYRSTRSDHTAYTCDRVKVAVHGSSPREASGVRLILARMVSNVEPHRCIAFAALPHYTCIRVGRS